MFFDYFLMPMKVQLTLNDFGNIPVFKTCLQLVKGQQLNLRSSRYRVCRASEGKPYKKRNKKEQQDI